MISLLLPPEKQISIYNNTWTPGISTVRQAPFCKPNGRSGRVAQVSLAMLYSTLPLGFASPPSIKRWLSSTLTKQALHMSKSSHVTNLSMMTFKIDFTTICYLLVAAGMLETADQEPSE